MSFVTTDLPDMAESTRNSKAQDSIFVEKRGFSTSSESPCSCNICSFDKLKEIERTLPIGSSMPYFSSWTTSQFSQTSVHPIGAHLAPRTGYEQPFWHRPSYSGWQYITSAAQVTHHAAFQQSENTSSMAYHFSRYHATKYRDTGCHTSGYHAVADLANGYHDAATENRLGRVLGGVAYDHGEFPKIVSVHSMAERPKGSSDTDCHGNDCNIDQSNNAHPLGDPLVEAKRACEDVMNTHNQRSTDHSISRILDLHSSTPVQNDKRLPEVISLGSNTRISLNSDEHELRTDFNCTSAEEKSAKISKTALESTNISEGLSNAASTECNGESEMTGTESPKMSCKPKREQQCPSTPTNIPPLKIRKNALIPHRVRRIKKIQKRLKYEQSERKKVRFLKKIEVLQKEIELLTSGSPPCESIGKDESPSTATPVKSSSLNLAPNKEKRDRGKMVDARSSERQTQDWKEELSVHSSTEEYWSSKRSKREMSGDGFRMNLFEKLGFWTEDSSCEVSTSSDSICSDGSSDSQTSEAVEEPVKEDTRRAFERNDELNGLLFHSEQPVDPEDRQELNKNVDILVKSADSNYEDSLQYKIADSLCSLSENLRHVYNESKEVLKRKQLSVVINSLSTKRRCKTLPRKVVCKYDPQSLAFDQERKKTEEIAEKRQTASKTEVSCLEENGDGKPFAANLNATSDVRDSCLSIKVDTDSSKLDDSEGRYVSDDDILQRKLELRESKISDLLRKQEGLLQTIEKMVTKPLPRN